MHQALQLKQPEGISIPSERTVYRIMEEIGLNHKSKWKPSGITKADREARKSDDLIKRDFHADKPLEKCITDMTEISGDITSATGIIGEFVLPMMASINGETETILFIITRYSIGQTSLRKKCYFIV